MTGAFPSACGKTNLAMLIPTLPDWKVETVGDDICWMKFGPDGRLYAINPEAGFFGVAPGTNTHTNPNAMLTLDGNAIFTNTALTDDGDVWWEGMTDEPPAHLTVVEGRGLDARVGHPGGPSQRPLHRARPPRTRPSPRSGRTRPACPSTPSSSAAAGPRSCPWCSSPATGSTASSSARSWPRRPRRPRPAPSATCAATPSPCCRSAATTWPTTSPTGSSIGAGADPDKLPKIFYVNWFRKDDDGRWLWPGYGENSRVLEWVFERVSGTGEATETPIGYIPAPGAIDTDGLDVSAGRHGRSCSPSTSTSGGPRCPSIREHFATFGDKLPAELAGRGRRLEQQLG